MSLPMPVTPKYETFLPVSKQKVTFRPFLVKEEKILMIANETNSIQQQTLAIKSVVNSCTFETLNLNEISLADIEHLFIMIRGKSIGEEITAELECSACGKKVNYTIHLEKLKMEQDAIIDKNIRIADDTVVTMRYPTINSSLDIDNNENVDIALKVTASCIVRITIGDDIHEAESFEPGEAKTYLENLTNKQLEKISEFMESIPKIVYEDNVKCVCGHENFIYMEGMSSFFN